MSRLEKLFNLLEMLVDKENKLEIIYGKDAKLVDEIGVYVVEIMIDELDLEPSFESKEGEELLKKVFSLIQLFIAKKINRDDCIKRIVKVKSDFRHKKNEKEKYQVGAYFVASPSTEGYQIMRITEIGSDGKFELELFPKVFHKKPSVAILSRLVNDNREDETFAFYLTREEFEKWNPERIEVE